MRKRLLIMTVGTGVGKDAKEKIKSLAHGLFFSISQNNPDKIIFIGSNKSRETVSEIELFAKEDDYDLPEREFVQLGDSDIDDFDKCYRLIEKQIKDNKDLYKDIIVDYTSGTKTMTMAAAIASMLYQKNLVVVSGKREKGIVKVGTERLGTQSLYKAYDYMLKDKLKYFFNKHLFLTAMDILHQIIDKEKDVLLYQKLIEAYDNWDKFRHEKAFNILTELKQVNYKDVASVDFNKINKNKEFLGRIANSKSDVEKYKYLLIDLVNNAQRRIEEGKYDDAVARLYRSIELIAQIKLLEYGFDDFAEAKFTLKDLQDRGVEIENYKTYADEKGKLKIGLEKKFELLKDLGFKKAEIIYNNKMRNLLRKRNNSILAHGLKPISKEDAKELMDKVKDSLNYIKYGRLKYEEIQEKAEFFKFYIK